MFVYVLFVHCVHRKVSAFCGVCVTVVNIPLFITNTHTFAGDSCNLIKQFAMPLTAV